MGARLRAATMMLLLATGPMGCQRAAPPSATPPPAADQATVNPDPAVTRYACEDGLTIIAGYPDGATAVVTYKDHAYTLKRAGSTSGARYVGYGLQWWVKGVHAAIAPLKSGEDAASGAGVDCTAAGDPTVTKV